MFGQIATLMENLHLSYEEVVYRIPYRNLLLMQRDKLRVATGDVMEEMDEKEFFKMVDKNSK